MKEATAEILRQLQLELIRLDDYRWRLEHMTQEELAEVGGVLAAVAEQVGAKAQGLAEAVSFARPHVPRPAAASPELFA
jgi:hypothetical protein